MNMDMGGEAAAPLKCSVLNSLPRFEDGSGSLPGLIADPALSRTSQMNMLWNWQIRGALRLTSSLSQGPRAHAPSFSPLSRHLHHLGDLEDIEHLAIRSDLVRVPPSSLFQLFLPSRPPLTIRPHSFGIAVIAFAYESIQAAIRETDRRVALRLSSQVSDHESQPGVAKAADGSPENSFVASETLAK